MLNKRKKYIFKPFQDMSKSHWSGNYMISDKVYGDFNLCLVTRCALELHVEEGHYCPLGDAGSNCHSAIP